ncbi:hypothetical protein K0B04_00095 [Patescibacteria group bacterium]|nr:hypothetical protein [Patescibacteria group bacterium]
MSKIKKGSDEILEMGKFFYFIELTCENDVTAAFDLQSINRVLDYEIINNTSDKDIWYIGPFGTKKEACQTQKILNARSNQIKSYRERNELPPRLWKFLSERRD